jgi:hypothetical protein
MKTSQKKDLFLQQMAMSYNITQACQNIGITRRAYYDWLKSDPDFVVAVDDIRESLLDHVESKVHAAIDRDDTDMIKWYLIHKGRARGYGEDGKQDITGSLEIKFIKEVVGNNNAKTN